MCIQINECVVIYHFTSLFYYHSTTRYNFVHLKATCKISPLEELEGGDLPPSSFQRLTGMYKVANMFTLSANQTRGHHLKLVKKRCNTTQRLNTFSIRIVDHWNNLSEDTVTANSINIFKSRSIEWGKLEWEEICPNLTLLSSHLYICISGQPMEYLSINSIL